MQNFNCLIIQNLQWYSTVNLNKMKGSKNELTGTLLLGLAKSILLYICQIRDKERINIAYSLYSESETSGYKCS